MQHDPMEIEIQIAELILGMPGRTTEDKLAAVLERFPSVTNDQLIAGSGMAVRLLEDAAKEYEAQSEAIRKEIERRRNL